MTWEDLLQGPWCNHPWVYDQPHLQGAEVIYYRPYNPDMTEPGLEAVVRLTDGQFMALYHHYPFFINDPGPHAVTFNSPGELLRYLDIEEEFFPTERAKYMLEPRRAVSEWLRTNLNEEV